jgi:ketosteroid isomerase-like protein
MKQETPFVLIERLRKARAEGDIAAVVGCHEPTSLVVVEPGKVLSGTEVIREFNEHVMKLSIMFEQSTIIEADGVAIHYSRWSREKISNGMITVSTGVTTDLLRRQQDGSWLLCLDNPWGIEVLPDAQRIRY